MSPSMEERLTALILRLEERLQPLENIDARLEQIISTERRIINTERVLTNLSLKLAASRFISSWVPGAIAGSISGAVVALIIEGARALNVHH